MTRAVAPLPVVTFLILMATLAPPMHGANGASLLATGTSEANGSSSLRFESDGGMMAIDIVGRGAGGAAGGGFLVNGPAGAVLVTVAKVPNQDGVLVDMRGPAAVRLDMTATTDTDGSFGKGLVFQNAPAGTYELIAFGAGDMASWTWSLQDEGARVVAKTTKVGGTWLATSRDFNGASNVQAFQAGAGARATDGKYPFHASSGLVGVFYPIHATSVHDSLRASTPTGSRDCTCAWLTPGASGDYTLWENGVGAGQALLADVLFIGADARFV